MKIKYSKVKLENNKEIELKRLPIAIYSEIFEEVQKFNKKGKPFEGVLFFIDSITGTETVTPQIEKIKNEDYKDKEIFDYFIDGYELNFSDMNVISEKLAELSMGKKMMAEAAKQQRGN